MPTDKLTLVDWDQYSVSEDGLVTGPSGLVSTHKNHKGYVCLNLRVADGRFKIFMLHRVVAYTHIPNPEGKPEVNHKDGDKQNNTVSNLEWCTHAENCAHAQAAGLFVQQRGLSHPSCRLTEEDVEDIRHFRGWGISYPKLGELYGISTQSAYAIVKRKSWAHL
jgi:hypothetical protein